MRIQYNDFAPNPSLRRTTITLPRHEAMPLIRQGIAIEIPYTSAADRLKSEGQGAIDTQFHGNVNPCVEGTQYHVKKDGLRVIIIKREGANETVYDGPIVQDTPARVEKRSGPCGDKHIAAEKAMPRSIVERWYALKGQELTAEQSEALRVADCERKNAALDTTEKDKVALHRILGK